MEYVKCSWFVQSAHVGGIHLHDDDDNDIKNNSDKRNSKFRRVMQPALTRCGRISEAEIKLIKAISRALFPNQVTKSECVLVSSGKYPFYISGFSLTGCRFDASFSVGAIVSSDVSTLLQLCTTGLDSLLCSKTSLSPEALEPSVIIPSFLRTHAHHFFLFLICFGLT